MRKSLQASQRLQKTIRSELAERTAEHQQTIRRFRTASRLSAAAVATAPIEPLAMLAVGDSWFDYPLSGNNLSLSSTDIIAQLQTMGSPSPLILNLSHWGDATTDELGLTKQQRMIEALHEPSNWLSNKKPDAILFSGGGNNIAGDRFIIFLDYARGGGAGLNVARFQGVLDEIEATYLDLFSFRDKFAPDVPIYAHDYDFAIPNGVHPACAGPWLKPSLDFYSYDIIQGTQIVHEALTSFKNLLIRLSQIPVNNFKLIDTQQTLAATDWANELHPEPNGFKLMAAKFMDTLRHDFNPRI